MQRGGAGVPPTLIFTGGDHNPPNPSGLRRNPEEALYMHLHRFPNDNTRLNMLVPLASVNMWRLPNRHRNSKARENKHPRRVRSPIQIDMHLEKQA